MDDDCTPWREARLDAAALVEAHLREDEEGLDALMEATDDTEQWRRIADALADMAAGEIRLHHGTAEARDMLAAYRQPDLP